MAEYVYTGAVPRLLFGLSQAVNAWHSPADGNPSQLAEGQTVVVDPGDSVRTDKEYVHAELEEIPAAKSSSKGAQK
jgi:hypothetical protein